MSIATAITRIMNLVHGTDNGSGVRRGGLEQKAVEMGIVSSGAKLEAINTAVQSIQVKTEGNKTLSAGESVTVPTAYNKNSYTVTSKDLASQTVGTAKSTDILSGKTAYVNGNAVEGSIQNYAGETVTPTNQEQTLNITGKYNTGNVVISGVNYFYTGEEKPSDSEHNDGDIFLVI